VRQRLCGLRLRQAVRWYDSEEYRALKALRLRTARGSVVLVEGV
jgi:uncharacterized protein (DUF1330 family)